MLSQPAPCIQCDSESCSPLMTLFSIEFFKRFLHIVALFCSCEETIHVMSIYHLRVGDRFV
jgi:hypothetical protein